MTATTARESVLAEVADGIIAERAAEVERKRGAAEARKAEAKRIVALEKQHAQAVERYLDAVANAEDATRLFCAALSRAHEAARAVRAVASVLGEPVAPMLDFTLARRLSQYISALFKRVPAAVSLKYGALILAQFSERAVRGKSWKEMERSIIAPQNVVEKTNGKAENHDSDFTE